jgi:hypothetical protein
MIPPVATVGVMTVPAPHVTHEPDPGDPCGLLVKATLHVLHVDSAIWPVAALYFPVPHWVHPLWPAVGWYVPAAQTAQAVIPDTEYVPTTQFTHTPPPPVFLPEGHSSHTLLLDTTPCPGIWQRQIVRAMGKSNPVVTSTSDGLAIKVFLTFPFGLARKALYSTLSPSGYHAAVSNADDTVISVVTTLVSSTIIRSFVFVLSATKTLVPSGENVTELGELNEANVPVLSKLPEDPVPANVLTTALPVVKSTRRTL